MNTQELIEKNRNAPVDTLVRKLFDIGATNFKDNDEDSNTVLGTVEDVLVLWYNLEILDLTFELNDKRRFVRLIHQYKMDEPHIEDIADYSDVPELNAIINKLDAGWGEKHS